ncbi:MAG: DUF3515 domain-containing protein [Nocardioidaceae bacterium]
MSRQSADVSPRIVTPGHIWTWLAATLVLALTVTGCGAGSLEVTVPTPAGQAVDECSALLEALPARILDQEARHVEPPEAFAAAWGDPAVVLRCGVGRPAALEPNSACFVANDVGWLADEGSDSEVVFTTIGRSSYVEVTVPDDYPQQSGALAELAGAISHSTSETQPCV